jgi:hypothetical protein
MAAMKEALGMDYLQPQRPLDMGSTLFKIASNCALLLLRGSLGVAVGPSQFSVETKRGCDLIQWALQVAMESNGSLLAACLDGINAFGEIELDCIRAALEAKPSLRMLIPMFEMLYERGSGQLWYYDENGNYMVSHYNRCGARQGCVLGAFLFCLAMRPVYARLATLLGLDGELYAFSDDVYLLSDPNNMSMALAAAPALYKKVGLRIGGGPSKTEFILPP